jgi:hypothetical protein
MAAAVPYNRVRFDAYRRCACEFVTGETYDCNELANMLHDLRWVEVPRAFSVALYNAARKGPLRPGLARNFKELLEYVTFLAFGSAERDVVQPWYLKNWDDFFVSCVEGILSLNNRTDDVLLQREAVVRRAFAGVLNLVEGARGYMSLDRLKNSTAAHALLVASGHCAHSFVWNGWVQLGGDVDGVPVGCVRDAKRPMTLAHTFLMDEIAASILDTQSFDVLSWDHAFGHFAGSTKWRSFAERCKLYASRLGGTDTSRPAAASSCVIPKWQGGFLPQPQAAATPQPHCVGSSAPAASVHRCTPTLSSTSRIHSTSCCILYRVACQCTV